MNDKSFNLKFQAFFYYNKFLCIDFFLRTINNKNTININIIVENISNFLSFNQSF